MHAIAQFLVHQQMAAGMLGATLLGSVLFSLKALPGKLWSHLVDQFSVTLTVEHTDPAFEQLLVWFSRRNMARRSRRLMLAPEYDWDAGAWRWRATLGRGWHLRWWCGRPLLINREIEQGGGLAKLLGSAARTQRIWLSTIGRSRAPLDALIAEVEDIYRGDGLRRVFFWSGGSYRVADARRPRPMASVFLPRVQKLRIEADLKAFLDARAVYGRRGTPYRRGYLLEGPPGTGKTSLIFALAGLIDRDVYAINLSNICSDNELLYAFNEIPPRGIVVIEDIDTAEVTKDRDLVKAERAQFAAAGAPVLKAAGGRLTLSGLLNAIDGLPARENRLLFVTSNAPETLDPALLRPGRIDVREKIDLLGREPAWDMYAAFAERPTPDEFDRLVAHRLPMSGSALQCLLQERGEHEPVDLQAVRSRVAGDHAG